MENKKELKTQFIAFFEKTYKENKGKRLSLIVEQIHFFAPMPPGESSFFQETLEQWHKEQIRLRDWNNL